MMKKIDINADLGEGKDFDAQIMPYISSCSIACGGHFGTDISMHDAVQLAKENTVKVGAHPSFPDRDNFGRKVLALTKRELTESVYNQLIGFFAVCKSEDTPVHHIKLHGALYNYAARDTPTADAVVSAIIATGTRPKLYVQYGSILHRKAENLLPLEFEAFIDRRYVDDGSLVSRSETNALITEPEEAWGQLYNMIYNQSVVAISGKKIPIVATTFCIHGDYINSVIIIRFIAEKIKELSISL